MRCTPKITFPQISFANQLFRTDQQRISCKCRTTLVRGIFWPRRPKRQYVPQFLFSFVKEIQKAVALGTEVANSKSTWQRSSVQQNSTGAGEFHSAAMIVIAESPVGNSGD